MSAVHRATVKLDISLVAQIESGNTIVGRRDLVKNAAFKNSDPAEHKILFGRIPYVSGIVDVEDMHFVLRQQKCSRVRRNLIEPQKMQLSRPHSQFRRQKLGNQELVYEIATDN